MRIVRLLPLMALLAACAPAAQNAEISSTTLEQGERYRLVFVTLGSTTTDQKVIDQVGLVIQQELAGKGLLLAAPWETPTLTVRYGMRGADLDRFDVRSGGTPFDVGRGGTVQPVSYTRSSGASDCDGSAESRSHCSALDGVSGFPELVTAPTTHRIRSLALEIREIASDRIIWRDVRSDEGEWTRATVPRIRPLVQATLTDSPF